MRAASAIEIFTPSFLFCQVFHQQTIVRMTHNLYFNLYIRNRDKIVS
jgi:hypothetical protein